MTDPSPPPIVLDEGRFARFERIAWWDQDKLRRAKVLVVGAGALGNEVIKNLALLGVGRLAIVDMDRIEQSNLSRSVLFRPEDEGRLKAEAAAEAARRIYPELTAVPLPGNVLGEVGWGWFRWADAVVGALDNREARLFLNRACALLGRAWIDGGIEVLNGIVRRFAPPQTACYECTMGAKDWEEIDQRRSCSLLARAAVAAGGAPTTPTTASVIGAIQTQEVVKQLHGLETLAGSGYVFEGLMHSSYPVRYSINPDCPWHEPPAAVETASHYGRDTRWQTIWDDAAGRLGGLDAIDLARELVASLHCAQCGWTRPVFRPASRMTEADAVCGQCGTECAADFVHSLTAESGWLDKTVGELGLPAWDVVWARHGERVLGIELAADRPSGEITK